MAKVLVTGGSGFLASHCILQLLAQGHSVRATLRSLDRQAELKAALGLSGSDAGLSFVAADLTRDEGWPEAAQGCDFVLHAASPFPAGQPKHEDELIIPAREGALRVLKAARQAGVKRVVMTSSFAAVGYGHAQQSQPFTEEDWADLSGSDVQPYIKSKALSERAAWDFMAREGQGLQLTVINPVGIFGPVLSPDFASSIGIIQTLLMGGMPFCPRIYFGAVDVRDAASLHLLAMLAPQAAGQRFLATPGPSLSMHQVAQALRRSLGPAARKVPRTQAPDWAWRLMALRNAKVRAMLPQLGKRRDATSAKARTLLGWQPKSAEEAVVATGESLVRMGLV